MNNYSLYKLNPLSLRDQTHKESSVQMGVNVRKNPVQKRSVVTKNKLKKAAKSLFADKGFYKVNSIQIAKKAGVPVGSFYNYFGNKKGILLELIEDFNEALHKETIERMDTLINGTVDIPTAKANMVLMLRTIINSPYLSSPFYKMFHALQFTEADILEISKKFRKIETDFLERYLQQIDTFHPIEDIPMTAQIVFISAENANLYINHLGISADPDEIIRKTALMFSRLIFGARES